MSEYNPADPRESKRLQKQADLFDLMHRKALDLARLRLPRPALFLDLGCGDGAVMKDLRFRRLVGVDRNAQALAVAQSYIDGEFLLADIEDPAFPDLLKKYLPRRPVLARLSLALHHLHDPVGIMQMLRQTLPPGSALLLLSPDQHMSCAYPGETFDRLYDLWQEAPNLADDRHGRKLRAQMDEAGLRDIAVVPYLFTTAGVTSKEKRHNLFVVFNEFRLHDWERASGDPRQVEAVAEIEDLLQQLEQEFQDPNFFFMATMMIGVARI